MTKKYLCNFFNGEEHGRTGLSNMFQLVSINFKSAEKTVKTNPVLISPPPF